MVKKNLQLYPAKVRVVSNCKLVKNTVNLNSETYNNILNGGTGGILEKKKNTKHGDIVSTYQITNADGYEGTDPLSFFDYSVLSACDSALLEGNNCISFAMILRALTGKTKSTSGGTHNGAINHNQRDAIFNSVLKLMQTTIKIDNSEVNEKLGYEGKKSLSDRFYQLTLRLPKSTDKLSKTSSISTKTKTAKSSEALYLKLPTNATKLSATMPRFWTCPTKTIPRLLSR